MFKAQHSHRRRWEVALLQNSKIVKHWRKARGKAWEKGLPENRPLCLASLLWNKVIIFVFRLFVDGSTAQALTIPRYQWITIRSAFIYLNQCWIIRCNFRSWPEKNGCRPRRTLKVVKTKKSGDISSSMWIYIKRLQLSYNTCWFLCHLVIFRDRYY